MTYKIITTFLLLTLLSCNNEIKHTSTKTELYFGLSNSEGAISDSSWTEFKKTHIDKILNGYTIIDGQGFWTDNSGNKTYEASKMLIYIHDNSVFESQKIDSIIVLYKNKFNQESVLKVHHNIRINN
ncbi:DUF3574 domain-containing protein [Mangrovimonas sp. TPBH4]|uniref:DUF3574 domain-containing protein n=1 Tax=Mangrovimonas sp. TPBH4 TaxID=1645914 RepID=UPI0006B4BECC